MDVTTTGNISLTNVTANSNGDATNWQNGINLSNTGGSGSITLSKVTADSNSNRGLDIRSAGAITLNTGSASSNGYATSNYGAYLDNTAFAGLTNPPAISVSKFTFNGNTSDGFEIYSKGAITLNNVTANDNTGGFYGGFVTNTSTFAKGVSILNTLGNNQFKGNPNIELSISSYGPVIVNGTTADGDNKTNASYGISINNMGGASPAADVSLSKVIAIGNLGAGIYVTTAGNISLSLVEASHNGGMGAWFIGPTLGVNKTATISASTFSENANGGLQVSTTGNITLTNVTASLNGNPVSSNGISVYNTAGTGNITLTNNIAVNTISGNWGTGLDARSNGTITISGVVAYHNHGLGIYLVNDSSSSGAGVTITNVNIADSYVDGLDVYSKGAITLTSGVFDQNGFDSGSGRGANLGNFSGTNKTVSVSKSSFTSNYGNGLLIMASGNITLNGVTSRDNHVVAGSDGVYLNNSGTAGSTVSVLNSLGANVFSQNDLDGLRIIGGGGAVKITGITANQNANARGVSITGAGTISVTNAALQGNSTQGLLGIGTGNITLMNVNSSGNYGMGAQLDNSSGTGTVTISKSTFSSNSSEGLSVTSDGDITLNNISASFNGGMGTSINNSTGSGKVSILSTLGVNTFNSNRGSANVYIYSYGDVTGDKITANLNINGRGVWVDYANNLTLTNITANSNLQEGLRVNISSGSVSISNATIFNNGVSWGADGMYFGALGYDVTIANSTILGNGFYGIRALIGVGQSLTVNSCLVIGNDRWIPAARPDIYTDGTLIIH